MTTIHPPPSDLGTFRVPAGIDSKYVVYSTGFETHEGGCRLCGGPAEPVWFERRYCNRHHKKYAAKVRAGKRPRPPGWTGEPGTCGHCGAELDPPELMKKAPICDGCRPAYRRRGFQTFKRRVDWPQPLTWFGPKVKRPPDDPQLPQLALALAAKGLLVVYVRADGTVGEVGRPKNSKGRSTT